jgi:hypothetical protein
MVTLLSKIKAEQPNWFSAKNKRFFGDARYYAYRSKLTNKPYLVRATYAWSDMFGTPKTLSYRINEVNPDDFEILPLIDKEFETLKDAKEWVFHAV